MPTAKNGFVRGAHGMTAAGIVCNDQAIYRSMVRATIPQDSARNSSWLVYDYRAVDVTIEKAVISMPNSDEFA